MQYDLVVSKVDHLLGRCVGQADNSLQSLRFQLFRVDRRKHLLQAAADHAHLRILAEAVEHHQRVSESGTEGLPVVVKDVSHSAVVDDAEGHLSASNLDEADVVTVLVVLQCHQVRYVVVLGSLDVGLEAELGIVLQLHSRIGVKAPPEVVDGLLQLGRTFSLLNNKHLWQFLLQLHVDLLMTPGFFLNISMHTLRPPTFGIKLLSTIKKSLVSDYAPLYQQRLAEAKALTATTAGAGGVLGDALLER